MTKQTQVIGAILTDETELITAVLTKAFPKGWTYEDAAAWLNEKLPEPIQTTKQSVHQWVNGEYKMSKTFLFSLSTYYLATDSQWKLAQELMNLREEQK